MSGSIPRTHSFCPVDAAQGAATKSSVAKSLSRSSRLRPDERSEDRLVLSCRDTAGNTSCRALHAYPRHCTSVTQLSLTRARARRADTVMAVTDLACCMPQSETGWVHKTIAGIQQAWELHVNVRTAHVTIRTAAAPYTKQATGARVLCDRSRSCSETVVSE